jgi:hypothetical protein
MIIMGIDANSPRNSNSLTFLHKIFHIISSSQTGITTYKDRGNGKIIRQEIDYIAIDWMKNDDNINIDYKLHKRKNKIIPIDKTISLWSINDMNMYFEKNVDYYIMSATNSNFNLTYTPTFLPNPLWPSDHTAIITHIIL